MFEKLNHHIEDIRHRGSSGQHMVYNPKLTKSSANIDKFTHLEGSSIVEATGIQYSKLINKKRIGGLMGTSGGRYSGIGESFE